MAETNCEGEKNALISAMGGSKGAVRGTYAPDDGHEVLWVCLWETTRGVHFMNEERDAARSEFLDEEMGEKVVIAREVVHVHDFGRTPFCPGCGFVSIGSGG